MALINLRNALMSGKKLPYDAEVEYLESTGTQYIDTGISGAEQNLIITAGVRINTFGAYAGAFGNYASENANSFRLILTGSNNGQAYANCGYVTSNSHIITNFSLGNWHTVILNGAEDRCFCDGVEFSKYNRFVQGTANANTIRIFTSDSPAAGTWSKQVSSFKVELNGVLVRDFIPVRKGTVGYLYDRVSGKLFGNAGTGDFVLGPDVVPVEYIESHGTQWINTGYSSTGVGIRAKVSCEKTTSATSEMSIVGRNSGDGFDLYFSGGKCGLWNKSGGSITSDVAIVANTRYSINAAVHSSGGSLSVNGELKTSSFSPATPSAADIVIFRHNNRYYFVGKIYDCELYDNDVLVRKFYSVRVGAEGAMMDVLTRRIYRNAGTGAFTYGNDLKYPIPAS